MPFRFGKGVVGVVGVVLWSFSFFFFILTIPSVLKFFLIKFQVKFEILLISPQARGLKEGRTEVHRNIVLFCFVLDFCFCCNWLVICRRYLYVTNTTWKNLTELKSQLQNHDEIEYTLLGRWKSRWKAWRMMHSGFGTGTSSSTGSFWCRKCIKTTWKERTGIYHRLVDRLASLSLFKHISDIVVVTKIFTFRQFFFFLKLGICFSLLLAIIYTVNVGISSRELIHFFDSTTVKTREIEHTVKTRNKEPVFSRQVTLNRF